MINIAQNNMLNVTKGILKHSTQNKQFIHFKMSMNYRTKTYESIILKTEMKEKNLQN